MSAQPNGRSGCAGRLVLYGSTCPVSENCGQQITNSTGLGPEIVRALLARAHLLQGALGDTNQSRRDRIRKNEIVVLELGDIGYYLGRPRRRGNPGLQFDDCILLRLKLVRVQRLEVIVAHVISGHWYPPLLFSRESLTAALPLIGGSRVLWF
jgi:hypothetical protein